MENFIQNANAIFYNYVLDYGQNTNIVRKIIHSFQVADKSYEIACKYNFNERERNLAYFAGLFHDIGRFEQWKRYETYNDHKSIDHGDLGYEILNNMTIDLLSNTEKEYIYLAIKYHTKPYDGENKLTSKYCKIIKNADAYSNVTTTANGAQQMTVTENGVTNEVLNDFINMRPLWIYSPKTKLDRALMLTACTYYVRLPYLRKQIFENNFIDIIYETFSKYLNEQDKNLYFETVQKYKNNYKEKINEEFEF